MNIILGEENVRDVGDQYLVLELDTLLISKDLAPMTAYCLVENVPIGELMVLDHQREKHQEMMRCFREREWTRALELLTELQGKWNKEVDTFYDHLATRLRYLVENDPGETWTHIVDRTEQVQDSEAAA